MSLVAKSNITYQETATPLVKTNNVIMDGDGVISFTDPDGVATLPEDKTVTGYRYFGWKRGRKAVYPANRRVLWGTASL